MYIKKTSNSFSKFCYLLHLFLLLYILDKKKKSLEVVERTNNADIYDSAAKTKNEKKFFAPKKEEIKKILLYLRKGENSFLIHSCCGVSKVSDR